MTKMCGCIFLITLVVALTSTHIDEFKVINTKPWIWIEQISVPFFVKSNQSRTYYLGNEYKYHDRQEVHMGKNTGLPQNYCPLGT